MWGTTDSQHVETPASSSFVIDSSVIWNPAHPAAAAAAAADPSESEHRIPQKGRLPSSSSSRHSACVTRTRLEGGLNRGFGWG